MNFIFLNFESGFNELSVRLGSLFGQKPLESDSLNAFKGSYFHNSFMGMKVRLEYNSYDYEDDYDYMITIKKDHVIAVENFEPLNELVTNFLMKALSYALQSDIARELNDKLVILEYSEV